MQKLNIVELSNILEESTIISTTDHSGMRASEITHPEFGNAVVIQGDDGGLLIVR